MKRVRVAIEVDESFVRLLQASVQLRGLLRDDGPDRALDPLEVLGVVLLGEMRGATEVQIHARTPPEWRPNIEVLHAERRVRE